MLRVRGLILERHPHQAAPRAAEVLEPLDLEAGRPEEVRDGQVVQGVRGVEVAGRELAEGGPQRLRIAEGFDDERAAGRGLLDPEAGPAVLDDDHLATLGRRGAIVDQMEHPPPGARAIVDLILIG